MMDIDVMNEEWGRKQAPKIKIKYFNKNIERIEKINIGDWIDLRCAADTHISAGEFKLIPLGIGMILPEGYEANIVPRGSTYKNFKILQTNSYGVVDNSYCGDNDQWFFPAYATKDTFIPENARICQFRINKRMEPIEIEEVEHLFNEDRGGFGSTGIN